MQDRSTTSSSNLLATHGRTIHWVISDIAAALPTVRFNPRLDDRLPAGIGEVSHATPFAQLTLKQPTRQRIEATDQLSHLIGRSGNVDTGRCLRHVEPSFDYRSMGSGALGATRPCLRI